MTARFSLEEMRGLYFDMGVNYESLPGETIETTALLDHLVQIRPDTPWHEPIEPDQPLIPLYNGLAYFVKEDSHLFFGHDRLTTELVSHLRAERFLIVVAPSGSRK